jgi:metal-responsive CopG/Arc/MetJ family transcriptional regulator
MKRKISITLNEELLSAVDRYAETSQSRSELIEEAVAAYVTRREKLRKDERERRLLDRLADRLNAEAEDVITFQEFPHDH